jgi:hypothetical protein
MGNNQEWAIDRHRQHWAHQIQDEDKQTYTDNIGHTRHRTKTNKHTQTTLDTQDTGRRQINIHRQDWAHKTQDEDKQVYTDNIGHTRHRTKTNKHKNNTTRKAKKMSNTDPTKTRGEHMCLRSVSSSCLL